MFRLLSVLALFALLASAAQAAAINTRYHVTGDPGAGVVQVFDDGRSMFVQLRDPTQVPAPFVDGSPVAFTVRSPFIVLPILPRLELRLGSAVVHVVRADGGVGAAPARVFHAVDALAAVPTPPPPPSIAVAGFTGEREVRGRIRVDGAGAPRAASAHPTWPHGAAIAASAFSAFSGRPVRVVGDGTVAGARDATRVQTICASAGPSRCDIAFRGAPSGHTTLEIL